MIAVTIPARIKSAWKSAQLLIAFHRDRHGTQRNEPRLWRPNDACAGLPDDPKQKEAFVVLRGDGDAGDVQIRMHPDKIILRRDDEALGWTGIQADHHGVSVLVGTVWITVQGDGSIRRQVDGNADDTSWMEADGSFIRIAPDAQIVVTGDGARLSRRTERQLDAITEDGVVSRRR
ncbi:hypothetical protein [Palleronia aestuarii]|uniref:hypothetical protein n=1 Tax=Palleronia aestuarii TaxID=568105 RepID=UPI001F266EE5|nr:hypothetical protein [Palleronia aestuarii]